MNRDGVFQRKDRAGWWVSYIDASGIRRKEKVEAHTRSQAATALSGLKTRAQTERILGVKHTSEMTTAEFFDKYKRYQKSRIRPTTFVRLGGILLHLKASLPVKLKDITKLKIASFVSERSAVVAPGTVQKEMSVLKHALGLAVDWELLPSNPASKAKLPRIPEGRTRYLSPTELRAAIDASPEWMKAPLALAAFTGMRRGELLSLKWKDVDMAGKRLYLHETKNGALRVLPLNDLAAGVLASLGAGRPSDTVLAGVDGPRLSVYTSRVFASLGIKDASLHTLRHTAASWLVQQGVDLYAVGQILGHKTPRMTQRYAHLPPNYMAGAVGKLDAHFRASLPEPSKSGDAVGTN